MTEFPKEYRVLLADDEPAARQSLEILLQHEADMELVASCCNGKECAEAIIELKPDLVLLDIQMPEWGGFEVLQAIKPHHLPVFIFVTAYDQFALKAFEESACDYLLKPYDDERFYESLNKARKLMQANKLQSQISKLNVLLDRLGAGSVAQRLPAAYPQKLLIKNNRKISFLEVEAIMYVESEGNFVKLHSSSGMKLGNYTFKQLQELLPPQKFVRIHKSFMVNRDFIEYLEPHFHGDYIVALKGGMHLKLSRNYKQALEIILGSRV